MVPTGHNSYIVTEITAWLVKADLITVAGPRAVGMSNHEFITYYRTEIGIARLVVIWEWFKGRKLPVE